MLTLADYYDGHDKTYAALLTSQIASNSRRTLTAANALLTLFGESRHCNSGWRPAPYNATIPGADPSSPHITGEAIDLADAGGKLKAWCIAHPAEVLAAGFVAIEDPAITPTWCHLQTREALQWQKGKRILLAAHGWENKAGEEVLTC